MIKSRHRLLLRFGIACTALLAPGSAFAAGSGGASLTGRGGVGALAAPADLVISTSGDGLTLRTAESGEMARMMTFTGTAPAADTGQTIEIEREAPAPMLSWTVVANARIRAHGAFSTSWRVSESGRLEIRAVLEGLASRASTDDSGGATGAGSISPGTAGATGELSAMSPPLTVTVFRTSFATLYGPSLLGHHTACGVKLTRTTLGVANRTLKCGTKVTIYFRGEELVVPVIDRGPYANHADWDLTIGTATALGITANSTIGTLTASQI